MERTAVKRNILLNPGPSTTTDTVKYAQVVPDICPREREFVEIMREMKRDLLRVVEADPKRYAAVLFCGSGTLNIDACVSSLLPEGKKILVVNNGSYSARAAEAARYYDLDLVELTLPTDRPVDVKSVAEALEREKDVAVVYACMHETGTGILNPVREIGELAHAHNAVMVADTTSAYALLPFTVEEENLDFIMASAQKGLMSMTGLSFVIGRKDVLEASKDYPKRSYYSNLYLQYSFLRDKGEMHFTPPVQTIYATRQALAEFFDEGIEKKSARHRNVWTALRDGALSRGFKIAFPEEYMAKLVLPVLYPDTLDSDGAHYGEDAPGEPFDFFQFHDALYDKGFTIYPGKVADTPTFRLCSLGAIDVEDIDAFYRAVDEILEETR
ncbi:MAG: 2-aminoethylphosphonate aminotransferase [Peptoniphilus sp.]|nr:2-aminoethylphosphonate aminotransferase [Peptoniphilus sp.]MDD7363310.1 2-aminoethylphosphonate aminotransferase [Bacillota bacterium]MDY6045260.1 2-aminoethylphosphonate aminotransferase [Peptoniphilus sp.]